VKLSILRIVLIVLSIIAIAAGPAASAAFAGGGIQPACQGGGGGCTG